MTYADDMISRAFPEAEKVRWGIEGKLAWASITWCSNPFIGHREEISTETWNGEEPPQDEIAKALISKAETYRSTRLVAKLLDIIRRECKRP